MLGSIAPTGHPRLLVIAAPRASEGASVEAMHAAREVAVIMSALVAACGGGGKNAAPAAETTAVEATAKADADAGERPGCYPYLRAADGSCPTTCATRDDCAGSRGPADFAENGWPLDCINDKCVPLPPERVHRR